MTQGRRPADLPPGPARDLVDLLRRLARESRLGNASIARRARLSPSYVSEVLNGRKLPPPDTAAGLAAAVNGCGADQLEARRLAEQLRELREYERASGRPSEAARRAELPHADVWSVCMAFILAVDAAHNALRGVARDERPGDRLVAGNAALQEAGVYAEREHLIAVASPDLVAAGEATFFALVAVRNVVRVGAELDSTAYHHAYHSFAEALWLFRLAVRTEFGGRPLSPETVHRESWSDRDRCPQCGR